MMRYLAFYVVLAATAVLSECSHMHGGHVYWKVVQDHSNGTVTIKVTSAVNFHGPYTVLRVGFHCFEFPPIPAKSIGPFAIDIYILDEDKSDKWRSLQGSVFLDKTEGALCKLSFASCCWINGLYSATEWSLPVFIDLKRRDGKINSSPIALHPALTRFVVGCPDSIFIPMIDPDGDHVTCRYGNTSKERGDVSNSYPYFSSDPYFAATGKCRISYNGGGFTSKVAVALIIEDRPSPDSQHVLSYSSLQFILEVIALPGYSCSDKPFFVSPTPVHNQIYSLYTGKPWQVTMQISSRFRLEHFSVLGLSNAWWQKPIYTGNNQYKVTVTWTPLKNNTGLNYMCYSGKDSRGLFTGLRCLKLYVDGIDPCEVNNGGCSDICSSSGSSVTCSCSHACWELASDGLRCLPRLETTCLGSRMTVRVDNCAFDNFIGLGEYPEGDPETNRIECWGNKFSKYYEFDIALNECGMMTYDDMNEVKHKVTVTMWVQSDEGDSPTSRGQWYMVETICTTEKYFNTSSSFLPEGTYTKIVADQQGFADIEITFDFYTDKTYQRAYSPYDYPLVVDVNDDVYFGILTQTSDNDVELFTTSCVAKPDSDPHNIGTYTMIFDGCLVDETMKQYSSYNPLINQFSVKAFQFQYGLPGIDENTNIVIQCKVVICSSLFGGTRCSQGCAASDDQSVTKTKAIFRLPSFAAKRVAYDDDGSNVTTAVRREENAETNSLILLKSGPFHITGELKAEPTNRPEFVPSTNNPTTSKASGISPGLMQCLMGCVLLTSRIQILPVFF